MFTKRERLGRTAFTQYFAAGRRFHTPALTLVYTPGAPFGVSVVVGKKVSKLAVGRNRIRRRIYAGMRRFFKESGTPAMVCIVIAKPLAATYTRAALAAELVTLLALPLKPR